MSHQTDSIIAVTDLQKSFKNLQVLKGVNFSVQTGSIFALLGSNGAGKTTIVRILSTLLRPDQGSASVCEYDVVNDAQKVRQRISLTGQFAAVDELLTGKENLRLMGALRHLNNIDERTQQLLAMFNLEDAATRQVSTYSGGMRRRLDIAMSLMGSPQVIFLDEPTTGLDPQNRLAMWDIVRDMAARGVTVFLTTQYLSEAEALADHVAILHEGVIAAEGTVEGLKRTHQKSTLEDVFLDLVGEHATEIANREGSYHV